MLLGDACWIDQVLPLTDNLFWIDHFYGSSFMVLYRSLYDDILEVDKPEGLNFLEYLSNISSQKLLVYPFISSVHQIPVTEYEKIGMKINAVRNIQNHYGARLSIRRG